MNTFSKRLLTLALVAIFSLSLAACGEETVKDTTAPEITGEQDLAYTIGDTAPDYLTGISATDDVDGDVTSSLVADSSAADLTKEGTYEIIVSVEDKAGNKSEVKYNLLVSVAPLSDEEIVNLDANSINLNETFKLKTRYSNGTSVSWTSSHPKVITSGGFINAPAIGEDDVTVTLTATFTYGAYTTTKTYDILVPARVESVVTSSALYDFEGTSDEYVVENKTDIEVFFIDNTDIPYVDVETFINMIDGAIEASELSYTPQNEDQLLVSYPVEWEDFDGTIVNETMEATIDFGDNTFTVDTFDFFENYISSTSSDYGEGLNYVDADYRDPQAVTIDLNEYKFDLIIHNDGTEDLYLMPFHVANLIFAGGIYYDAYFNGDMIYGIDTFGISSGSSADLLEEVRTSSMNDESMSVELKTASFNYMILALDYFYGLKEDQEVTTYEDFMYDFADDFVTKTDTKLYTKVFEIAYALNDMHTSHQYSGFYADPNYNDTNLQLTSYSQLGPRVSNFYQDANRIGRAYEEKFPDGTPNYSLIDNDKTAVIHIEGFNIDTPNTFELTMQQLPETVENVVVDLANNTGGNIGAVLRIFGYITEEAMMYHSQNPADGSAVTYYIESDYEAYDQYNWYFLSSPKTFSAANMMVSMAKELGYTVIGQQSSGGASSIGVLVTPDGSIIMMSTNNVLSTRIGNEVDGYDYKSVEFGVEPTIYIESVTDDAMLIAAIEQDQAETE